MAVAAAVSLSSLPAASGQSDGAPVWPIEIGFWVGQGQIVEDVTFDADGITIGWNGALDATFRFAVVPDTEIGASIDGGDWDLSGDAVFEFGGSAGVFAGRADAHYEGAGEFTGTLINSRIELAGQVQATGSAYVTVAAGGEQTIPISQTIDPSPMYIEIETATCNEAYGRWAQDIEMSIAAAGFNIDFEGPWMAFRDVETMQEEVAALLQAARLPAADAPIGESNSPLLAAAATLLQAYNSFVARLTVQGGFSQTEMFELLEAAESLLNEIRNLTDCDRELFGGGNVEQFASGLTLVIQGLAIAGSTADLPSDAWQRVVQVAGRSGAIGPGAANPAAAAQAEQALIDAGSRILEANVDPEDGRIWANDDTRRVMSTGAAMGWQYTVNGETWNARLSFEAYLEAGGEE